MTDLLQAIRELADRMAEERVTITTIEVATLDDMARLSKSLTRTMTMHPELREGSVVLAVAGVSIRVAKPASRTNRADDYDGKSHVRP